MEKEWNACMHAKSGSYKEYNYSYTWLWAVWVYGCMDVWVRTCNVEDTEVGEADEAGGKVAQPVSRQDKLFQVHSLEHLLGDLGQLAVPQVQLLCQLRPFQLFRQRPTHSNDKQQRRAR